MKNVIDKWLKRVDEMQKEPTWKCLCTVLVTISRDKALIMAREKSGCRRCSN